MKDIVLCAFIRLNIVFYHNFISYICNYLLEAKKTRGKLNKRQAVHRT